MPPFKQQGPSADFEKVKGGGLPKRDTNLRTILYKSYAIIDLYQAIGFLKSSKLPTYAPEVGSHYFI